MFADIQRDAGGVGVFRHNRQPASIDEQTVIRLNRDTLYSFAILDLAEPAWLSLPEADGRSMSAMAVNEDHYINVLRHPPGRHQLTCDRCGSRYVMVGVRTPVDPLDPDDVAAGGALQDRMTLETSPLGVFTSPEYDRESLDKTRQSPAQPCEWFDRLRADIRNSGRGRSDPPSDRHCRRMGRVADVGGCLCRCRPCVAAGKQTTGYAGRECCV